MSRALLTQIVDAFCHRVEAAGYFVGFYASTSWLKNKLDTAALCKKYTLWKADYRLFYDKTISCDMHQFTSEGTVDGINGNVDLSHCYRDFETAIRANGLNGFAKPALLRTFMVKASEGDIKKFAAMAKELKISDYTVA